MLRIPSENRDLRRYVRRRYVLRMLGWIAWIGMWILGAVSYNQNHQTYPPERRMVGWRFWLLVAVAAIAGAFLFRIWQFLSALPFEGWIQSSRTVRSYSAGEDPGKRGYAFRVHMRLCVRNERGSAYWRRIEQKNGFYQYYYEGARVLHFFGLPYPIRAEQTKESGYLCVACGRIHAKAEDFCESCGLSLIDPATLKRGGETTLDA